VGTLVETTYYSLTGAWLLHVPESWRENVTAVRVTGYGQASTTFMAGEITLFTVYSFTGVQREDMASRAGMIFLTDTGSAIYTASLGQDAASSPYALTENEIKTRFALITQEWTN
jgi:hypothetical protein